MITSRCDRADAGNLFVLDISAGRDRFGIRSLEPIFLMEKTHYRVFRRPPPTYIRFFKIQFSPYSIRSESDLKLKLKCLISGNADTSGFHLPNLQSARQSTASIRRTPRGREDSINNSQ